jgi:integration host factor subunit beta
VTKRDLILRVASNNPSISKECIERAVNLFFEAIAHYLSHHQRVELRGLGSFSVRVRKSYTAHNPRSREYVDIHQKFIPFYRPSTLVKKALADQGCQKMVSAQKKKRGFFMDKHNESSRNF